MKNRSIFLVLFAATIATIVGCSKRDTPKHADPTCINAEIEKMQKEPVRNPVGSVWQYSYKGKTVYYIPSACCDRYSELLDGNCNPICSPDGGITGKGDGRCADFFENRTGGEIDLAGWEIEGSVSFLGRF